MMTYKIETEGQALVLYSEFKFTCDGNDYSKKWSTKHFNLLDLFDYISGVKVSRCFVDMNLGHFADTEG
jgi:hypothetical protein|tara:strand:+ start:480 stop:686 length:207 start_codon:yes stop_codon:yes gene_type:complete